VNKWSTDFPQKPRVCSRVVLPDAAEWFGGQNAGKPAVSGLFMVLPDRIELSASPLPRGETAFVFIDVFSLVHDLSTIPPL
jgi:hypothetical protein